MQWRRGVGGGEPHRRAGACGSSTRRASTTTPRPRASYNELRLTPRTELRQTALETKVVTMPRRPQYSYLDYWGTHVVAFNVDRGHEVLTITGNSLVDTQTFRPSRRTARGRTSADATMTMADHLAHNLYTAPGPELSDIAAGPAHGPAARDGAAHHEHTHESLRYVRGVTSVHTSADEAYADGAGVCQDFAHLALALTKSVGLPSRYVSGYFHPDGDAAIGEEIAGESHAWVEVWTGRWWAYDPTNDLPGRGAPRRRRARARLRRRPAGQGDLRRQRREHHARGGAHGEGPLSG